MCIVWISFPGEAATGVVCPRETGEMKIDDCRECPNFKPCMAAIVEIWTEKGIEDNEVLSNGVNRKET